MNSGRDQSSVIQGNPPQAVFSIKEEESQTQVANSPEPVNALPTKNDQSASPIPSLVQPNFRGLKVLAQRRPDSIIVKESSFKVDVPPQPSRQAPRPSPETTFVPASDTFRSTLPSRREFLSWRMSLPVSANNILQLAQNSKTASSINTSNESQTAAIDANLPHISPFYGIFSTVPSNLEAYYRITTVNSKKIIKTSERIVAISDLHLGSADFTVIILVYNVSNVFSKNLSPRYSLKWELYDIHSLLLDVLY